MAEDRIEKYGLTSSTSKPIKLACWDWSLAVKTLQDHHEREPEILSAAVDDFNASVGREHNPVLDALRQQALRLAAIAENRRDRRAALVDELMGMRPAIEDVVDEEKELRPSRSVLIADHVDRRLCRRRRSSVTASVWGLVGREVCINSQESPRKTTLTWLSALDL